MAYLSRCCGHRVIGVELSDVAVDTFFAEQGLEPVAEAVGLLIVKRAGPYEIWCGDIDLPPSATTDAAVVYDCAAPSPCCDEGAIRQKLMQLAPEHAPIVS